MAYTSGIFHIDLVNGSDAARTALTSCTASNPSGSITRINKTAHGLVTGAVVDLTLFTSWLNSAWKITVVDADNFDLDTAVWEATADTSGTVTPRGGMNWADAWLTITNGATTARVQPGDEFRISKTPDQVSLGQNATWTDGSQTVTLTTAVTKKIEDAISGWTASANITASTNASRKLGATALVLTPAGAFTTGKVAYATIAGGGTQDFSAYRYINFWMRPTVANGVANTYRIYLCSDATGDTGVNIVNIPSIVASTNWQLISIDTGGALGSNIQSVAIYAFNDPGTTPISINNIFASNGDLSLKTLIGKTGDVLYNIQSIDGTTIKIDSNNTAATGRGYSGATSTETLYYRVPLDFSAASGNWQAIQEAGNNLNQKNHYSFGWDTASNIRNGDTLVGSTVVGVGVPISTFTFIKISNVTFARMSSASVTHLNEIENVNFVGGGPSFSSTGLRNVTLINCKNYNLSSTPTLSGSVLFVNCNFYSNASVGLSTGSASKLVNCSFANNGSSSISFAGPTSDYSTGSVLLKNCLLGDASEISINSSDYSSLWSIDHDQTPGNKIGLSAGVVIQWQTAVKQGSDPGAWLIEVSQNYRNTYNPAILKIAEVAVSASSLVTVQAWVKKDHATNVAAKLLVEDELYSLDGIVADSATKASDTSWEELEITFTPSVSGVVPIFVHAWYVAGSSNIYVGSITVTQ